ncbi:MAG: NUDIX hydrolase N-terminal domain-containing protein, partial [Fusobacteria bacterium]|nr:NUDIX hydrolase N-terminal domain-containing protein [Fusobacteriota bacterium]
MKTIDKLLNYVKQIESISEAGLHFSTNDYDTERFENLQTISLEMISLLLNRQFETVKEAMVEKSGYKTPKVDVRGIVLNEKREILMVREKFDGLWSLPGGWADIGLTIKENVAKEVIEEAGIVVIPKRILAVMDKKCYPHPRDIY